MADLVDLALATRPSNMDAVEGLIKELSALQKDLHDGKHLMTGIIATKARTLVQSLQTPCEMMMQHTWADPGLNAALITGVDIGLWKLMVKDGADKPQMVDSLAKTHVR
ncbi:hypothetical protein FSARC_11656 [Fusarium sarcochroum]|uniref:Uncharacterized protein n=1 Tax=Fusarium sarcochroum TaxID=1208366 RepID=A0A8H4TE56_9HYPO|nr:hypothetical protein FSARC_11656 [Fusarium sarcochroum]